MLQIPRRRLFAASCRPWWMQSDSLRKLSSIKEIDIMDGNQAAARVAYHFSDTNFIYPITPSSTMGELVDKWQAEGRLNAFGQKVDVTVMQSEGGAAGAVHGALSAGALASTFTSSQGLLLMIPNMYKIAGELSPCVFHVAARAIAGQALSIFGDHQDVMATRQTGCIMLCSHSVQEAQDLALISHIVTLKASLPVTHFFDGWRTSHEISTLDIIPNDVMTKLIPWEGIQNHHDRSLNPTRPHVRGTSQSPDIYMQLCEAANPYYDVVPEITKGVMKDVGELTGRHYNLFDYYGHDEPEHVLIIMGSASYTVAEVVDKLTQEGRRVGLIRPRLFRPWSPEDFVASIPESVKVLTVMDRTVERGAIGEPLLLDVLATMKNAGDMRKVLGGYYGLGSKEFTPAMALSIYENMFSQRPKNHFCVGVEDDVTQRSLTVGPTIHTVPKGTKECIFWGVGGDGTVGANTDAIQIIGKGSGLYSQAYFQYDSKKSLGVTRSHLRFGPEPITSQYLIQPNAAEYVACHHLSYLDKYDILEQAKPGATFVLNSPWTTEEMESKLLGSFKRTIAEKNIQFYNIDATAVAEGVGLPTRINVVMQAAFFKLSGVLPVETALDLYRDSIRKRFSVKGDDVVNKNLRALDLSLTGENLVKIDYPSSWKNHSGTQPFHHENAGNNEHDFVESVLKPVLSLKGDELPVSAFTAGGFLPPGTAAEEQRAIASAIPIWNPESCTQCNRCAIVCPHACVRPFLMSKEDSKESPESFTTMKAKGAELAGLDYRIQVSPVDCTGCEVCVHACPEDCFTMEPLQNVISEEKKHWNFAKQLPVMDEVGLDRFSEKGSQFFEPLMEFSGACAGCGETPYVKLVTQLFGERLIIANATGCSSIWGASAPSNPYTVNKDGRGPAWGNSLFEDNAEYGLGMAVATRVKRQRLVAMIAAILEMEQASGLPTELQASLESWQSNHQDVQVSEKMYKNVKGSIASAMSEYTSQDSSDHFPRMMKLLVNQIDMMPVPSHWLIGGDGWAYDIGFGGLDHVLNSTENVNVLVLDTEGYSNTGGHASKATPIGTDTKFAAGGKKTGKKDLGAIAMTYGGVYVASVAMGANYNQCIQTFKEAEEYDGPSLILAYSPCIDHQIKEGLEHMMEHEKVAVESGYWPLYRYNPANVKKDKEPFQLDSKRIKKDLLSFLATQNRFDKLKRNDVDEARRLQDEFKTISETRMKQMQRASMDDSDLLDYLKEEVGEQTGEKILILYASETGTTEQLAQVLQYELKRRNVRSTAVAFDDFDVHDLPKQSTVINLVATCGQGEFPNNSKLFWEQIQEDLPKDFLASTKFATFGMGDSHYVFYNECANLMNNRFEALGSQKILPMGQGDDQDEDKWESGWNNWEPDLFGEIGTEEPPQILMPAVHEIFTIEKEPVNNIIVRDGGKIITKTFDDMITPGGRDNRHYEFHVGNMPYSCGDSLGVYPHNPTGMVEEFCDWYGRSPNEMIRLHDPAGIRKPPLPVEMSIHQLFSQQLDIFGWPKRRFYEMLSMCTTDEAERKTLQYLISKEGKGDLRENFVGETLHYWDVLKMFPNAQVPLEYLIDFVSTIKPRLYSIASSQEMRGEKLHLCVVSDDWTTPSGVYRHGNCTGYLKGLPVGSDLLVKVNPAAIQMPPDQSTPMVMVGLGTGYAPFRAFMEERKHLRDTEGKNVGPMALFFGARNEATEFLYQTGEYSEIDDFKKSEILTELHTAFSRDQDYKIYVQDRMNEQSKLLYDYLVKGNGYFYLCGPSGPLVPVRNAVVQSLVQHGGMTQDEADKYVTNMQITGRYNVEVW